MIGGFGYTPQQVQEHIHELKSHLADPSLPWGLDLAIPQVGGENARKTNKDYTRGRLAELVQIAIDEHASLFVSAVGVPPRWVIEKLHESGILVMNMVGHPRHAEKALSLGVDLVCAQGSEGGGHTGDIASSVLVPAVVDVARRFNPPLLAQLVGNDGHGPPPALVVAAGGISDGRGLAAALMQGACGVWVGTRFVASVEAACGEAHKEAVVSAGWDATETTLLLSGRPLRARTNDWMRSWHDKRGPLIRELCEKGIVPMEWDLEQGNEVDVPFLMGQVAGAIKDVKPAGEIVEDMVREAAEMLRLGQGFLTDNGSPAMKAADKGTAKL